MATMNTTLSRKLQKVLETKTDSPELHSVLQNLSTFYGENTVSARRNLRGEIEKRGIEINNEFLQSFKEVQKVFKKQQITHNLLGLSAHIIITNME